MKKILIISILIIGFMLFVGTSVFATIPNLNELDGSSVVDSPENTSADTNNNNTNNNNNNSPEQLANTGTSIYILPIIAMFTLGTIYAYKKTREYNI